MDMALILATIKKARGGRVYPSSGLPVVRSGEVLPDDLRTFYELCGGVELFSYADYPISIVPPQSMKPANSIILIGLTEEELADPKYDASNSWYIISDEGSGQYITIDTNPRRLGYCYDSFWDIHPLNSTIISYSFTELLLKFLHDRGEVFYKDEWKLLGRVYDPDF